MTATVQIQSFQKAKQEGRPIVALTAADYGMAGLLDEAGIDLVLVGDSLAMTTLGYANTLPLTLEAMIHHCAAVTRGIQRAFVVADLPFMTYQVSQEQALISAGRLMKEAGVAAVKLEGGYEDLVDTIRALVQRGIPVMGHIGLTPQSKYQLGGFRQQGRTSTEAERLVTEAQALESAGCFAVVLEHMPSDLAQRITHTLRIPTIGIGAGSHCDGQILVTHDLLGLGQRIPPFAKAYLNLRHSILEAVQEFSSDVRSGQFPPNEGSSQDP